MPDTYADRIALRMLVDNYAIAADRRDDDAFVALFTSDATLTISQPATKRHTFEGPDGLRQATAPLDAYVSTMHLVANHTCTTNGDTGSGTTYCLANHLRPADDGGVENFMMVIRYEDTYARGDDGLWRFVSRHVVIQWTEVHPASVEALSF